MKLSIFFVILLFSSSFFSQTVSPRNDTQFWNETQLIVPLIKAKDSNNKEFDRVSLLINGTMRVGQNWQQLVDERIGFGFDFKVNKFLTLSPAYLYRADQPYQGKSERESRLRFAVSLEKKFDKFSLKNRNLIERRFRYRNVGDSTRYRNKLLFAIPVLKNKKELFSPFIADEVFYDFSAKKWTRNELSIGITKKFTNNFSADFFYLYQRNTGNILKNINALGINFKIKID